MQPRCATCAHLMPESKVSHLTACAFLHWPVQTPSSQKGLPSWTSPLLPVVDSPSRTRIMTPTPFPLPQCVSSVLAFQLAPRPALALPTLSQDQAHPQDLPRTSPHAVVFWRARFLLESTTFTSHCFSLTFSSEHNFFLLVLQSIPKVSTLSAGAILMPKSAPCSSSQTVVPDVLAGHLRNKSALKKRQKKIRGSVW